MDSIISENGKTGTGTVMVFGQINMEIAIMDNGRLVREKATVFILLGNRSIEEISSISKKRDGESKNLSMAIPMRDNISKAFLREKEGIPGIMELHTKANLS
jgi:hypothetical protein